MTIEANIAQPPPASGRANLAALSAVNIARLAAASGRANLTALSAVSIARLAPAAGVDPGGWWERS